MFLHYIMSSYRVTTLKDLLDLDTDNREFTLFGNLFIFPSLASVRDTGFQGMISCSSPPCGLQAILNNFLVLYVDIM